MIRMIPDPNYDTLDLLVSDSFPRMESSGLEVKLEVGNSISDITFPCVVCSLPASKICSWCRRASYCSRQHQAQDWKRHKKEVCLPVKESQDGVKGRVLVATRDIPLGQVILEEEPLLRGPLDLKSQVPLCLGCCRVLSPSETFPGTRLCEVCKWPLCSSSCPDRSIHESFECKIFEGQSDSARALIFRSEAPLVYQSLLVLRCLLLQELDSHKFQLISNMESLRYGGGMGYKTPFTNTLDFTIKFIQESCNLRQHHNNLIEHLLGVVTLNTNVTSGSRKHDTQDTSFIRYGSIYSFGSKILHSCASNCETIRQSHIKNRLLAVSPIGAGDQLTHFYFQQECLWRGTLERRAFLEEVYHFSCACPKCTDKTEFGTFTSAIKCQQGLNCPGFLLPQNPLNPNALWGCGSCPTVVTVEVVHDILARVRGQMDAPGNKDIGHQLGLIRKLSGKQLHENHFLLMERRAKLVEPLYAIITLKVVDGIPPEEFHGLAQEYLQITRKCLDVFSQLHPGRRTYKGHILFHLAQSLKYPSLAHHILEEDEHWTEYCQARKEAMEILQHEAVGTDGASMRDILKDEYQHTVEEIIRGAKNPTQLDRILTLFREMGKE